MADLLLLVTLAGRRVALPAATVEAVIEVEAITPVPQAAPHVVGLSALRSRVLTVIDGQAALGGPRSEGAREAVVVASEGHPYVLLLDAVEDVVDAVGAVEPVRAPLGGGWDRVAEGLVTAGGDVLLLVDPHRLIAGPAAVAA